MSNISSITQKTAELGDDLLEQFKKDKNIKTASTALSAYKTAITAAKTKLMYEKAVKNFQVSNTIEFLKD
jgi:hypothetical protein